MSEFVAEHFIGEWSGVVLDEPNKIVRNVALCGLSSKNGYSFESSVFSSEQEVNRLYDGKMVCIDHKRGADGLPLRNRSIHDFAAVIKNPRLVNGRPRGDLHGEGCEQWETLRGTAKSGLPNVGLSHVAAYQWGPGKKTIKGISEVATVDLVLYPATTTNLQEQHEGNSTMTDPTDKTIGILEKQLETHRAESDQKIESLKSEIQSLKAENEELKGKNKTLHEENEANKGKVLQFEQAEKVQKVRASVLKLATEKGIDVKSKLQCPDSLIDLCVEMDESKRGDYLQEWAKNFGKPGSRPSSSERADDNGGDDGEGDKWDAESELKKDGYRTEQKSNS